MATARFAMMTRKSAARMGNANNVATPGIISRAKYIILIAVAIPSVVQLALII
jgi:hypothetical protein